MEQFDFGGEIVWRPDAQTIARANLTDFMQREGIGSYPELLRRSVEDVGWFWDATIRRMGFVFDRPYDRIVDLSRGIEWPKWCVGARMNIVKSLLHRWLPERPAVGREPPPGTTVQRYDQPALIAEHEDGSSERLTYQQLKDRVDQAAAALQRRGIGPGDVVAVYLPMNADCVVAMLAILHLGAIFLPMFSGFGAGAILSRMTDANAKALISCQDVQRRGKRVPLWPVAQEVVLQLAAQRPDCRLIDAGELRDAAARPAPEPHITDAETPMMLIYTSGTTGKPKGAVHTHCGFPIKGAADAWMGLDLHPQETIWWMTDMGWMMGPWLVFSALAVGATMVTYDGAPDFPGVDRTWEITAKHGVTTLGVSPTLIRSLLVHGEAPVRRHDLTRLQKFASTGEPWNPEPWSWLFRVVGESKRPIINYSGGTEISGGILMGNVLSPLKPCAFAGPLPGMDADVVDEAGRSVRGQVGELVLRKPWIGQTRGFFNDPGRYLETYWSRFPGVWVHGDFAAVDRDGQWYILGRSDDTIKVAGKRIGPAEIESILVSHPRVKEAAVIGVPDEVKGQSIVCFVVLKNVTEAPGRLADELRERIVHEQGKPLAPREIHFVADLPRTRNAKVMRRVIRAAFLGQDPGDLSSLENPAAVEHIPRCGLHGADGSVQSV
ncbi:MAG: AMP-binding protein [Phycisphaerae bacterium]|nr:AMP-binding protein [Phycisphaerae bacterium]